MDPTRRMFIASAATVPVATVVGLANKKTESQDDMNEYFKNEVKKNIKNFSGARSIHVLASNLDAITAYNRKKFNLPSDVEHRLSDMRDIHDALRKQLKSEYGVTIPDFHESDALHGLKVFRKYGPVKALRSIRYQMDKYADEHIHEPIILRVQKAGDDYFGYIQPEMEYYANMDWGGGMCYALGVTIAILSVYIAFGQVEMGVVVAILGVIHEVINC